MTKLKLYRKTVHLDGIDIFNPRDKIMVPRSKNWDINHQQIKDTKKETYTTFIGESKEEINNALSKLTERMLISDRARTVNNVPKYRIIKSTMVRAN